MKRSASDVAGTGDGNDAGEPHAGDCDCSQCALATIEQRSQSIRKKLRRDTDAIIVDNNALVDYIETRMLEFKMFVDAYEKLGLRFEQRDSANARIINQLTTEWAQTKDVVLRVEKKSLDTLAKQAEDIKKLFDQQARLARVLKKMSENNKKQ